MGSEEVEPQMEELDPVALEDEEPPSPPFGYVDIFCYDVGDPDNPEPLLSYEVRKKELTIGRGHTNDIRLNDNRISRIHGTITIYPASESEVQKVRHGQTRSLWISVFLQW